MLALGLKMMEYFDYSDSDQPSTPMVEDNDELFTVDALAAEVEEMEQSLLTEPSAESSQPTLQSTSASEVPMGAAWSTVFASEPASVPTSAPRDPKARRIAILEKAILKNKKNYLHLPINLDAVPVRKGTKDLWFSFSSNQDYYPLGIVSNDKPDSQIPMAQVKVTMTVSMVNRKFPPFTVTTPAQSGIYWLRAIRGHVGGTIRLQFTCTDPSVEPLEHLVEVVGGSASDSEEMDEEEEEEEEEVGSDEEGEEGDEEEEDEEEDDEDTVAEEPKATPKKEKKAAKKETVKKEPKPRPVKAEEESESKSKPSSASAKKRRRDKDRKRVRNYPEERRRKMERRLRLAAEAEAAAAQGMWTEEALRTTRSRVSTSTTTSSAPATPAPASPVPVASVPLTAPSTRKRNYAEVIATTPAAIKSAGPKKSHKKKIVEPSPVPAEEEVEEEEEEDVKPAQKKFARPPKKLQKEEEAEEEQEEVKEVEEVVKPSGKKSKPMPTPKPVPEEKEEVREEPKVEARVTRSADTEKEKEKVLSKSAAKPKVKPAPAPTPIEEPEKAEKAERIVVERASSPKRTKPEVWPAYTADQVADYMDSVMEPPTTFVRNIKHRLEPTVEHSQQHSNMLQSLAAYKSNAHGLAGPVINTQMPQTLLLALYRDKHTVSKLFVAAVNQQKATSRTMAFNVFQAMPSKLFKPSVTQIFALLAQRCVQIKGNMINQLRALFEETAATDLRYEHESAVMRQLAQQAKQQSVLMGDLLGPYHFLRFVFFLLMHTHSTDGGSTRVKGTLCDLEKVVEHAVRLLDESYLDWFA